MAGVGWAVDDSPVSKRELERLRSMRDRPMPKLEPRFLGPTDAGVRAVKALRAERERYVESRLRGIDGHVENEFACAAVSGRAKHDFDRSR